MTLRKLGLTPNFLCFVASGAIALISVFWGLIFLTVVATFLAGAFCERAAREVS